MPHHYSTAFNRNHETAEQLATPCHLIQHRRLVRLYHRSGIWALSHAKLTCTTQLRHTFRLKPAVIMRVRNNHPRRYMMYSRDNENAKLGRRRQAHTQQVLPQNPGSTLHSAMTQDNAYTLFMLLYREMHSTCRPRHAPDVQCGSRLRPRMMRYSSESWVARAQ